LPFSVNIAAAVKKDGVFDTEKGNELALKRALTAVIHVDCWLASSPNTIDPDAFLNANEDRKSLQAMLEIKQKIYHAFDGNRTVRQALNIWREAMHPLSLDSAFAEAVKNKTSTNKTSSTWSSARILLAECAVMQGISDREFIARLTDPEMQKEFACWAYLPPEEGEDQSAADIRERRLRDLRHVPFMRYLSTAPEVVEYAKTSEA
jgi:hypothetical protein